MNYETDLESIRLIMADQSPEVQVGYRLDRAVAEVDELCAIAIKTPELLDRRDVGALLARTQLLASFLLAATPRVIQGGRQ